jgi:hypothetical protein
MLHKPFMDDCNGAMLHKPFMDDCNGAMLHKPFMDDCNGAMLHKYDGENHRSTYGSGLDVRWQ